MKTRAAVAFEAKQPLEIMATGICYTDAYTLDGLAVRQTLLDTSSGVVLRSVFHASTTTSFLP